MPALARLGGFRRQLRLGILGWRRARCTLPPHTTFDLSLGKSFGENWNVRLTGLNLVNHRYLLDNSNTFGGTHYVNPREISVQVKYRFRF